MSRLSEVMADSFVIRPSVPQEFVERYDRITEAAMHYAAGEDAREAVAAVEDAVDERPLAPIVELFGFSRNAS